jgi:hypothetical protein
MGGGGDPPQQGWGLLQRGSGWLWMELSAVTLGRVILRLSEAVMANAEPQAIAVRGATLTGTKSLQSIHRWTAVFSEYGWLNLSLGQTGGYKTAGLTLQYPKNWGGCSCLIDKMWLLRQFAFRRSSNTFTVLVGLGTTETTAATPHLILHLCLAWSSTQFSPRVTATVACQAEGSESCSSSIPTADERQLQSLKKRNIKEC